MSQDHAAPVGVYDQAATVTYPLATRMAAEAAGTLLLVLGIVGTATFNFLNQGSILTVALAGGIMLMAAIAAFGHVSGGHFNPAVTFGLAIAGRASWKDLLPYWLAQFVGATAAAGVLWAIIPQKLVTAMGLEARGDVLARTVNGWGAGSPLSAATQGQADFPFANALIVEIIIAAVFVGVILGVTGKRSRVAYPAAVIGLTLGALHIISWPITNTSFNPARSFASVVFAGNGDAWGQLWLFILAPLVGAGLAALFALVFAPTAVVASTDAIDELEDIYEIVPAESDESAESVASAASAESADSAPAAEVAEPAEVAESAEVAEPAEADVEEAAPAAEADDIAAPEGSTPEKRQA